MTPTTGAALVALGVLAAASTGRSLRAAVHGSRARRRLHGETTREMTVPPTIGRMLADALPEHDPAVLVRGWAIGTGALSLCGWVVAGPAAAVTAAATVAASTAVALWAFRDRASRLGDAALVLWIDASARAVRSGASLAHALAEGADVVADTPLGDAARRLAGRARRGEIDAGLRELTVDGASEPRRLVHRALRVAVTTGGPAGRLLDGVASSLRDRVALHQEIRALATQARVSAVVIVVAPLVFGLLVTGTDRRVAEFMFATPAGWACVGAGALLDALGAAWMARLVRGVT